MSDILEKIGFRKRTHVGISLSANNFIELVCVDKDTKSVIKYASGNIKYNNAIREIMDYDEFTEAVEGLFDEAGLDPSECAVSINLPNVHFGITALESSSETPFIIDNLQAEIEDLYVFKRNEPFISYTTVENEKDRTQKNIVFSAIQRKVVVKLDEIFENMGCELVRVDSSYSSLLKTIQFCDRFNKYMQKEEKTSLLLITPNSCCAFYMENGVLADFFEEPLAVKSFSTEEVYSTISKIAENAISNNAPQSLIVISEADEVNPELLSSRLSFEGEIECVNKSVNSNDPFIDISEGADIDANMVTYLTIEAVGAAVADYDDYPIAINFLPNEKVPKNIVEMGGYEIELQKFAVLVLGLAVVLALIIIFASKLFLDSQKESFETGRASSNKKIEVFKKQIKESGDTAKTKNIFPVLQSVIENNDNTIAIYNALSTETPKEIYIKRFVTNSEGGIGILGESTSSDIVNEFVKALREKNGDLMLSKLSVNTPDDEVPSKIKNGFTFEIKTSSKTIYLNDNDDVVQNAIQNGQNMINNAKNNIGGNSGNVPLNNGNRQSLTPPPPVI